MKKGKEVMSEYKIEVERDGRWWMISVPEIEQLTQARRIDEIEVWHARSSPSALISQSATSPFTSPTSALTESMCLRAPRK